MIYVTHELKLLLLMLGKVSRGRERVPHNHTRQNMTDYGHVTDVI